MITIKIIYHSGYNHTKKQAEHVKIGADKVDNTKVDLVTTEEAIKDIDQFANVDAIIFGSPTYMGSVSADFKQFMDASSSAWFNRSWKDKIAAGFTNSGSMSGEKMNTLNTFIAFAMQHAMIWVGQAELDGSPKEEPGKPDAINRIGSALGAMAQSIQLSPDQTSASSGDLKTAEILGQRVANITKKFKS
ncbi:MAG: flavodoxin family protein [SAR324 cluster bacterium]|nr:flavodoxin family protein [SAR324 cluster bacterium]